MKKNPALFIGAAAGAILAAAGGLALWWWWSHRPPAGQAVEGTKPAPVKAKAPDPAPAEPTPTVRTRATSGPKAEFTGVAGALPDVMHGEAASEWVREALAGLPAFMAGAGHPMEARDALRFSVAYETEPPGKWAPFVLEPAADGGWDITLSLRALMLGAVDPGEAVRAAAMTAWFRERLDGAELDRITEGLALLRAGVGETWFKRGLLDGGQAGRPWNAEAVAGTPFGRYVWPLALSRAWWEPLPETARAAVITRLRSGAAPSGEPAASRNLEAQALLAQLTIEGQAIIQAEDRDARENFRRARELESMGKLRQAHNLYRDLLARWPESCIAGDAGIRRAILLHRLGLSGDAAFLLIPAASGEPGAHARDSLIADGMLAMADIRFQDGLSPIAHDLRDRLDWYALTAEDQSRARYVGNRLAEVGWEGPLEPQFEPAEPVAPVKPGDREEGEEPAADE